jgi:hypothetical protein
MTITKPPKPKAEDQSKEKSSVEFIENAPDAKHKAKGVPKGKKQQISLTIAPVLLEKIDVLANELGQSRAAVINLAIYRAVEKGLVKD